MNTIARASNNSTADQHRPQASVVPLRDHVAGTSLHVSLDIHGAVLFVLLIACVSPAVVERVKKIGKARNKFSRTRSRLQWRACWAAPTGDRPQRWAADPHAPGIGRDPACFWESGSHGVQARIAPRAALRSLPSGLRLIIRRAPRPSCCSPKRAELLKNLFRALHDLLDRSTRPARRTQSAGKQDGP